MEIRGEEKLKQIVDFVLDYVKDKVDYSDLLIENVSRVEAKLLPDGQELIVPYSSKVAMQLRLIKKDGRHIGVSLGLEDEEEMKKNIDIVLTILEETEPNPEYGLAEIPNPEKKRYGKQLKADLRDIDTGFIIELVLNEIKEMVSKFSSKNNISLNPEITFFSQIEEKIIADTKGIYKTQILPVTFFALQLKAKKDDKMSQFNGRCGDIDEIGMLLEKNKLKPHVRRLIEKAMDNTLKLLSARKLTDEELKKLTHYILAPSTMVFVHEAQGHNFEADIIKEGGSGLIKADGTPVVEEIASDIVHIYDAQPMDSKGNFVYDKGFGTQYIDDEGVEVKPVQLVKNGKITGKLHNRETAFHYKEEPNGRGFSELGDKRVVRMTNTYISPASKRFETFDELIKDVKLGIFLEGSLGGAMSKDGMSTSLQIGYLIKDGKLTDTVLLPANMAVITKSALLTAEGFTGDVTIDKGIGFCGKEGQSKFVTDGGPITKLRVSDSINLAY